MSEKLIGRDMRPLSDAQARLKVSTTTLYAWAKQGRIPAEQIGGRWYIPSEAFDTLTVLPAKLNDRLRTSGIVESEPLTSDQIDLVSRAFALALEALNLRQMGSAAS